MRNLFLSVLILFSACQNHIENNSEIDHLISNKSQDCCDFEHFLKDPNTPLIAKELYHGNYILRDDGPLSLLSKLNSSENAEQKFYFRVITNSYKIAGGAYAEGLGAEGRAFVENNTLKFSSFFDTKCFTKKDLEIWAKIVTLDSEIEGVMDDEGNMNKYLAMRFCNKLTNNCKKASHRQQQTIAIFNEILKEEYKNATKKTL